MFSVLAGRPTVALVRRSILTLQASLKPHVAHASGAAGGTSTPNPPGKAPAPTPISTSRPSSATPPSSAKSAPQKHTGGAAAGGGGGGGGGGTGGGSYNCPTGPPPRTGPPCCDTAFDFKGKTILVTGAGRGMGKATVNALTACGAMVIGVESNKTDLDCVVAENCGRVIPVHVDLCDWDKTKEALTPVLNCPIDGAVNNAAILIKEPFLTMTREGVQKQLLVNVVALLHVGMLCAQNMVKHKRQGTIVNFASISSQYANPDLTVYCVTKGAVAQATRSMAAELGCHGIRVNAVSPTVVLTDMGKKAVSKAEEGEALKKRTPMGRYAEVCEVVDLVLFLLGDRSTYVNGANVPVDGGFWAA